MPGQRLVEQVGRQQNPVDDMDDTVGRLNVGGRDIGVRQIRIGIKFDGDAISQASYDGTVPKE